MTKLAIGSLVLGLVAAAVSLPYIIPAFQEINRNTAQLKELNAERDAVQTVQPEAQVAEAGPISTGIAEAAAQRAAAEQTAQVQKEMAKLAIDTTNEKPKPAPPEPEHYYTPSCGDSGSLKQAVNPTPRGTPYSGVLLVSTDGHRGGPCYRAGTHAHPTLGKFGVGRTGGARRLGPGTHPAPGGTVTIER